MSIPLAYEAAVEHATAALKQEGFGVLMSIDVRQTLKQKLDIDFRKYVILGACNPPLAHRALLAELDIGLLLPCNVIVYESGPTQSVVAVMAPMSMIAIVGENPALAAVAREAAASSSRGASAGDRVVIGIDARVGWELHLRVNGFVGLRLGR